MDDARGDLEVVETAQPVLGRGERLNQHRLLQPPAVVMHLQRPDAGCHVDDAGQVETPDLEHQRVNTQAQFDVEDDGAIFDQQVAVALLPVRHGRASPLAG